MKVFIQMFVCSAVRFSWHAFFHLYCNQEVFILHRQGSRCREYGTTKCNQEAHVKEGWWVIFIQAYIGTYMYVCINTHIHMHVCVLNMW